MPRLTAATPGALPVGLGLDLGAGFIVALFGFANIAAAAEGAAEKHESAATAHEEAAAHHKAAAEKHRAGAHAEAKERAKAAEKASASAHEKSKEAS